MPCTGVNLPGGGTAIVCTTSRRQRCACGRPSTRLCDWKVAGRRSGTCDRPLCDDCTDEPAPEKDLCPAHADQWRDVCEGRAQKVVGRVEADLFTQLAQAPPPAGRR